MPDLKTETLQRDFLTRAEFDALVWLRRLNEPNMYRDRIGPFVEWLEPHLAALAATSAPAELNSIEQYCMQMAGICTAAIGYWKEGDSIHPDYDTIALRDVAKLYAKYDELFKASAVQRPEDEAERIIRAAISASPKPLRDLGEHLANWLNEDQFATAEQLMLALATSAPSEPDEPVAIVHLERWADGVVANARISPSFDWGALPHGETKLYAAPQPAPAVPVAAEPWQPIETAPKDGTQVLLSNGESVAQGWWEHQEPYIREKRDVAGNYIDQDENDGYDGWLDCQGGMLPEPTHWMPLPDAATVLTGGQS